MNAPFNHPRPLRIVLYANVERDEAGGAQSVVRTLRDNLQKRGHAVSIGWNNAKDKQGQDAGEWVAHFPLRAGQQRWLHLPSVVRLCARLLRERPDVVNIHFASASARYFYTLAPWFGYHTMLTCHGSDLLDPLPQDIPHLSAVVAGADAVTAVSQDIATRIGAGVGTAPGRIAAVIPNGVDTRFWQADPHGRHAAQPGRARIIAIGRLERVKGFDLLIDAFAQLVAAGTKATLMLIGDGSERARLEHQARAAGIADQVVFTGRLPPEDVRARLHEANLFVLPSRSEGTPLALLEAMAAGTPCIAARVGGIPAIADQVVRLVPPEDTAQLGAAIADLLANPRTRDELADKARERANAFSVERTYAAYEALMLGLMREAHSSAGLSDG